VVSVRGVILYPRGNQELTYARGIGISSNNEVEALLVYQGWTLLIESGIKRVTMIGDSKIVIRHMHQDSIPKDVVLSHIIARTLALIWDIKGIEFYQMLRKHNCQECEKANLE